MNLPNALPPSSETSTSDSGSRTLGAVSLTPKLVVDPAPGAGPTLSANKFRLLCCLLIGSGVASLTFQVLWLRGFGVIVGSTIHSMSCVTTVFMLGLALGSMLMARVLRSRELSRPLLVYGLMELAAGLFSLAVSWLLFRHQDWLLPLNVSASAPFVLRLASQFGLCLAMIGVPTALMGMTLPVVSLLVPDPRQVATLYGFNTLGAAAGSVIASFVLISEFGVIVAAAVAAGVDALIFVVCYLGRDRFAPAPKESDKLESTSSVDGDGAGDADADDADDRLGVSATLMLLLAGFSGFISLSCEITWTRFLSLCFGNRVYVTSITLAVILLFMAQAARMSAKILRGPRPLWRVLLTACALAVISFAISLQVEHAAFLSTRREFLVLFLLVMVIFPATALGLLFPITLAARPAGVVSRGVWVGRTYGVNTLASLFGSLLSGYVLMGAIGSNGIIAFNATLLVVATVGLAVTYRKRLMPADMALLAATAICFLAMVIPNRALVPPLFNPADVVVNVEDANGIFNVVRAPEDKLRVVYNRTDLVYLFGDSATQYVQETQAYYPVLYAPRLNKVLNLCSGYGITAGAFASVKEVGHVDAVEIVPAMVEHADLFRAHNFGYYQDPKVKVFVEDGRYFLASTPELYDIISVNVTDPYLPGTSSMFSQEFYQLVRSRLAPGGVLSQHIFGPDQASLYHGIKQIFPYVKAIPSYDTGLTVVAGLEPLEEHQRDLFESKYDHGRKLLSPIGLEDGLDGLDRLQAKGDARIAELETVPNWFENSDVMPYLEFRRIPGELGFFYTHQ
jgi:spermidine synthase